MEKKEIKKQICCRKCGKLIKDLFGVKIEPLGVTCHPCQHPHITTDEEKELAFKAIWYQGLIEINAGRGKEFIDAIMSSR